jgi:hypothetical protein
VDVPIFSVVALSDPKVEQSLYQKENKRREKYD